MPCIDAGPQPCVGPIALRPGIDEGELPRWRCTMHDIMNKQLHR